VSVQLRDPERDRLLRSGMRAAGLRGILAWYPEDIVMMCGTWPCSGIDLCLYPAQGEPVFYASRSEPDDVVPPGFASRRFTPQPGLGAESWQELKGMLLGDLGRLEIPRGGLGIAGDGGLHAVTSFPAESPPLTHSSVEAILPSGMPVDATGVFTDAGLRKTPREIDAIRAAIRAAARGLEAFRREISPGRTEAEIAAAVEGAVQGQSGRGGCRLARGWAHVQSGANTSMGGTFSRSSGRPLAEGDLVLLELAVCADGYWCDLTRTASAGRPGKQQRALLQAVWDAQSAAISAVRPGVLHEEVDRAARRLLEEREYGAGFTHNCGHHVGFRYHDRGPVLEPGSRAALREGMVLTIEPGAYGPAFGGGARFEDDVLVVPGGAEVLSPRAPTLEDPA
jgi:Xaa-Pro dipeptidase